MALFFGYSDLFEIEFAERIFFFLIPGVGDLFPDLFCFKLLLPVFNLELLLVNPIFCFDLGFGVILLFNFNDLGLPKLELFDRLNFPVGVIALYLIIYY